MAVIYSICIPTYRRPGEVKRFLEMFARIAGKTGLKNEFEICISDNNEDLSTKRIVEGYRSRFNIRYFHWGKNVGYDRNSLQAMKLATGKYFHVASDEIAYEEARFAALMDFLGKTGADGICIRPRAGAKTPLALCRYSLSPAGVAGYYATYMSTFIMKREFLAGFLTPGGRGAEKYIGMEFIHLPLFLYFLRHAETIENFALEMDFGKQGVLLPSRMAQLYLHHYFFLMKICCESRLLPPEDFARFKQSFLLALPFLFFKVRMYMNPEIYKSEIAQVGGKAGLLCGEYGRLGRAWISLWRIAIFNPFIPYHSFYRLWYNYKAGVKKDRRSLDLFEEYGRKGRK